MRSLLHMPGASRSAWKRWRLYPGDEKSLPQKLQEIVMITAARWIAPISGMPMAAAGAGGGRARRHHRQHPRETPLAASRTHEAGRAPIRAGAAAQAQREPGDLPSRRPRLRANAETLALTKSRSDLLCQLRQHEHHQVERAWFTTEPALSDLCAQQRWAFRASTEAVVELQPGFAPGNPLRRFVTIA